MADKFSPPANTASVDALLVRKHELEKAIERPKVGYGDAFVTAAKSAGVGYAIAHFGTLLGNAMTNSGNQILGAVIRVASYIGSFAAPVLIGREVWGNRIENSRKEISNELDAVRESLIKQGALIPEKVIGSDSLVQKRQELKDQMQHPDVGFWRATWIAVKTMLVALIPASLASDIGGGGILGGVLKVAAGVAVAAPVGRHIWSNRIEKNRNEAADELAKLDLSLMQRGALVPEHVVTPQEAAALRTAQASGTAQGQHSSTALNPKENAVAPSMGV